MPIVELLAILDAEGTFDKLGRHAEETCHDQPEGSTRATDRNRYRDTTDVTDADRSGYCSRQGLKMRDLTMAVGIGIITAHQLDRVLESAQIDKAHVKGKKHGTDYQPQHHYW